MEDSGSEQEMRSQEDEGEIRGGELTTQAVCCYSLLYSACSSLLGIDGPRGTERWG